MVVELDERTCSNETCRWTGPAVFFPLSGIKANGEIKRKGRCPECVRDEYRAYAEANREALNAAARERYRRRMESAAERRKFRRRSRDTQRRRASDPEVRRKDRASARRYQREVLSTKSGREYRNRQSRERRARLKAEDPEAFERLLARERERRKARKRGRARKRDLENRRIAARLRAERKGAALKAPEVSPQAGGEFLPVGPILALVHRRIEERARELNPLDMRRLSTSTNAHESPRTGVCERLGVPSRTLYAWEHAERTEVAFDVVDQILTRDGTCMFEVYPRCDDAPEATVEQVTVELLESWKPGASCWLPWAWAGLTGAEWLERQAA